MSQRLRLEDFPDDEERRPEPQPGSIAFRCRQARRVVPGLASGTVGRVSCLTSGHYYRIEQGVKVPSIAVVRKLVKGYRALGVDVTEEWLAFEKGRGPRKLRVRPAPVPAAAEAAVPDQR